MTLTSAAGIISLLSEDEAEVKAFALKKLNSVVDQFWPEISEAVELVEVLHEDKSFPHSKLAALVASKVYYHLGAYDEALNFALGAGKEIDLMKSTEFTDKIVSEAIDRYILLRRKQLDSGDQVVIDPRLEAVVRQMFQKCIDDKQFKHAIGIAIETHNVEVFEEVIKKSENIPAMLDYSFKVVMNLIENRHFRNQILWVLVKLYHSLPSPDYISVAQCLIYLDNAEELAKVFEQLISAGEQSVLLAFQIAFDLYESATQQFIQRVIQSLKVSSERETPTSTAMEWPPESSASIETPKPTLLSETPRPDTKVVSQPSENTRKLIEILLGDHTINLHLQFLIKKNKTDMQILKQTKEAVRQTVCHTATVIANSYMHAGTTSDQFLRDNLDWLKKATNWARFTATASLGVIHKGHEKDAKTLMATYLPDSSTNKSVYSDGGGLYALGLIYANHGGDISDYLLEQLNKAKNETVKHGACLGLGLAAMGTARQDIYEKLRFDLYQDDAVVGEAAGIAIGLVMLGTANKTVLDDLYAYAKETQHEKILRGIAIGMALIMYGRLEEADATIEKLLGDKDPVVRWAGIYMIASAYAGTGNNASIRRLLHVAVSDSSDDVRRMSVIALGFLYCHNHEQLPAVVSLLAESYAPHLRYGSALALGIACAGTGSKEAMALLDPMLKDSVAYVRQGALIASALVLVQQNTTTCPKSKAMRETYAKTIADKHEEIMVKFGAILAQGIIDAGGRNATISLQSRTGHTNMQAVVGMMVFCQFWFWFPLSHFLSLAFAPTCVITLNRNLQMPKMSLVSSAKPSVFAVVPPSEDKKGKKMEKVETAVLSITERQRKKLRRHEGERAESADSMNVDKKSEESKKADAAVKSDDSKKVEDPTSDKTFDTMEVEGESGAGVAEAVKPESEPEMELLTNPARVMPAQLRVISLPVASNYGSIKDITTGGIVMVTQKDAAVSEELVEVIMGTVSSSAKSDADEGKEPDPPEPFEWEED